MGLEHKSDQQAHVKCTVHCAMVKNRKSLGTAIYTLISQKLPRIVSGRASYRQVTNMIVRMSAAEFSSRPFWPSVFFKISSPFIPI